MIDFKVTVLGCGSAVPSRTANPSSQLVSYRNKQFMIDCGEGTQMRMIQYNAVHRNLDHIFISHLHGDHFYGLAGLISSFHLLRRKIPLYIYAPRKLKSLLEHHFEATNTKLFFQLVFRALEDFGERILFEDEFLSIAAFPLKHSTPTWGFVIREKDKRRRINKDFIQEYSPNLEEIYNIVNGGDFITEDDKLLSNHEITIQSSPSRAFAYCSDTAYDPSIIRFVEGVDLLYHEATFDNLQEDKAQKYLHATAAEAAKIANQARVKNLLIGHFSGRYKNLQLLLNEAKEFFTNTQICEEGREYIIS